MNLVKAIIISAYPLRRLSFCTFGQRYFSSDISQGNNVPEEAKNDMPVSMENPFVKEKEKCILCKLNITPDYKNTKLLSQFISPFTGRVYGRHITRLCRHKQEQVNKEIIKSQKAGFMPYYHKDPLFLEDPKLFNPEKPLRNHDF